MNPNHGHYMAVVDHPHDGCHWNPQKQRGSLPGDAHFRLTHASVLVGARDVTKANAIQYRLCEACARLPRWHRGHRHSAITQAKGTAA